MADGKGGRGAGRGATGSVAAATNTAALQAEVTKRRAAMAKAREAVTRMERNGQLPSHVLRAQQRAADRAEEQYLRAEERARNAGSAVQANRATGYSSGVMSETERDTFTNAIFGSDFTQLGGQAVILAARASLGVHTVPLASMGEFAAATQRNVDRYLMDRGRAEMATVLAHGGARWQGGVVADGVPTMMEVTNIGGGGRSYDVRVGNAGRVRGEVGGGPTGRPTAARMAETLSDAARQAATQVFSAALGMAEEMGRNRAYDESWRRTRR